MRISFSPSTLLCGFVLCTAAAAADFAAKLPAVPCGIGRPAADRGWWAGWAATPEAAKALAHAEARLSQPMPAFDPERYLDYTRNGDRTRYQSVHSRRWDRLNRLVLGECLENKGRFLPAIDESVRSLCADPSWVLPAHDSELKVFHGDAPYADLAVACNGWQMALAAWLLEDRLPADTIALMRGQVRARLIQPVLQTIDGTAPDHVRRGHFWMGSNHNWTAVCAAGALGAILAVEPSPEVRAKAAAWAVENTKTFLSGFGKDGYCSEGIGYWNYGFGHFIALSETLRWQTDGAVDLLGAPALKPVALGPALLEISSGVYPGFADCGLNARPDRQLLEWSWWRQENRPFSGPAAAPLAGGNTLYFVLASLSARREAAEAGKAEAEPLPPHSWFADSGVCIIRPDRPGGMAVAWKGGHNGEHHNHNDIGSTVVVWRGRRIITDPGGMTYRAETFGKDRYRLPPMSSYAHSAPVPAGFLQATGGNRAAKVLAAAFSPAEDHMVMDLAGAYPDSGLTRLEREWRYSRGGDGTLSICDRFAFTSPSSFETALPALGKWFLAEAPDNRSARFVADAGEGARLLVNVRFSAPGKWNVTEVENPGHATTWRLGLVLSEPVSEGQVTMEIRPLPENQDVRLTPLPAGKAPARLDDPRKAP